MRVIAGSAGGRHLKGPPRRRGAGSAAGIRPSSDLIRGALFSALDALGADYTRTLDLYAGTGALGIETLSRGGEWCDFVERDRAMAEVIRENLEATGFGDRAKVHTMAASSAIRLAGPYTLVIADPPYADSGAWAVLEEIAGSRLATPDPVIAVEHSSREEPPGRLAGFHLKKIIRHGDSAVSLYMAEGRS
jgi:16S rRNA (guanine966-N2)-methyltransferase